MLFIKLSMIDSNAFIKLSMIDSNTFIKLSMIDSNAFIDFQDILDSFGISQGGLVVKVFSCFHLFSTVKPATKNTSKRVH